MSFTEIYTIVGTAAGFITALAALITILEMRKQRRAAYYDEVILTGQPFAMIMRGPLNSFRMKMIPANVSVKYLEESYVAQFADEPCYLLICNIGNRPVTNVSLQWNIDIPGLISCLKDFDVEKLIIQSIDEHYGSDKLSINKLDDILVTEEGDLTSVDVLLGCDLEGSSAHAELPYFYYESIKYLVYLICIANKNEVNISTLGLPPILPCQITFNTIDGKKRHIKYELEMDISMFGFGRHRYNPQKWNVVFQGKFSPVKIL